jgi:hypothetical protein
MSSKQSSLSKPLVVLAAIALAASGIAFADHNSMSRLTGDSYAYFNNLDSSPGKFNTARTPGTEAPAAVAKVPGKEREGRATRHAGRSSVAGHAHEPVP